jgi:hypothetical protein
MEGVKRTSDEDTSKDRVVIQRVICEVGSGRSYPALMKVKLKARALWSVIEDGGTDQQEEMMVLDALCVAVPPEMMPAIAKMETAKEAWDAIATKRISDDRMKKVTA